MHHMLSHVVKMRWHTPFLRHPQPFLHSNGGVFDVSWDLINQGAYMTYCWLGPCQGPDANFGELGISCIA